MNQVIKTIIVDDESKSRVVLRTLVKRLSPQIELIGAESRWFQLAKKIQSRSF
jgi:hypothetical protein